MNRPTGKPHLVRKTGILAIGLDCEDGHTRITRGDNFVLFGGSDSTHQVMRDKVTQFNQELERRGKTIDNATEAEIDEITQKLD